MECGSCRHISNSSCFDSSCVDLRCAHSEFVQKELALLQPCSYGDSDMRRAERSFRIAVCGCSVALALSAASAAAGEVKATDFALMDRLTWGVTTSGAEHLRAVGTDRWLDEQLHPKESPALPPSVQSQIEDMPKAT